MFFRFIQWLKDWKRGTLFGAARSSKWSSIRKDFLILHNKCDLCGKEKSLEVHHIKPFHSNPEFELNPQNLITLCESKKYGVNCHLFCGHLGNYKRINPLVVEDCKIWNYKLKTI